MVGMASREWRNRPVAKCNNGAQEWRMEWHPARAVPLGTTVPGVVVSARQRGAAESAQRAQLGVDAALAGSVPCAQARVGTTQCGVRVCAGQVLVAGVGCPEVDGGAHDVPSPWVRWLAWESVGKPTPRGRQANSTAAKMTAATAKTSSDNMVIQPLSLVRVTPIR